jgi:hypothetical protein
MLGDLWLTSVGDADRANVLAREEQEVTAEVLEAEAEALENGAAGAQSFWSRLRARNFRSSRRK